MHHDLGVLGVERVAHGSVDRGAYAFAAELSAALLACFIHELQSAGEGSLFAFDGPYLPYFAWLGIYDRSVCDGVSAT